MALHDLASLGTGKGSKRSVNANKRRPSTDRERRLLQNDQHLQGKLNAAAVWDEINAGGDTLSNATIGYGLGNWFLYNGQREQAEKVFRKVIAGNQWASFGYIAAEAELKRPLR